MYVKVKEILSKDRIRMNCYQPGKLGKKGREEGFWLALELDLSQDGRSTKGKCWTQVFDFPMNLLAVRSLNLLISIFLSLK